MGFGLWLLTLTLTLTLTGAGEGCGASRRPGRGLLVGAVLHAPGASVCLRASAWVWREWCDRWRRLERGRCGLAT